MVSGSTFAPTTGLSRKECVIGLWKHVGSPEGFFATQYLEVEKLDSDFGRSIGWSHTHAVMESIWSVFRDGVRTSLLFLSA